MNALDNLPVQLEQEDRATIDFVKNVKAFSQAELSARVAATYKAATADRPARTTDEVAAIVEPLFTWKADRLISRQSQEIMWTRLFGAMMPHADDLLARLDATDSAPVGSLRLNPEIQYPPYYEVEYHIQPGGQHKEPLIGYVLAYGQAAYHAGRNDRGALKRSVADAIPDGPYRRILDMACGLGESIFPIQERFPNAELYGVDLSAPLLKYCHRAAEEAGLAFHLSQQNAEKVDFPDGSFDVVTSCILFHEIPSAAAVNVIREGYRLLCPGGYFQIGDITPFRKQDPYRVFFSQWQTLHNGEPYWTEAGNRDLPAWLREVGFVDIAERPSSAGLWITSARKPL